MERDEFLSKLGFGLAAVCAGGCLVACGKSDTGSPAGGTSNPPAGTTITINLDNEIKTVGTSKVANGVIIARLAAGNDAASFTAVQVSCTHEGTAITYDASKGNFVCPSHFSEFSTAGAVTKGPAASNLKKYTITTSGSTLTVKV